MARLFVEANGRRYEKKFRGKAPYYVDERGREVGAAVAKALDQARAAKVNALEATRVPTSARHALDLTESSYLLHESAQLRYRALRQRKPAAISEADRLRRRRDLLIASGMSFHEASIAAHGR